MSEYDSVEIANVFYGIDGNNANNDGKSNWQNIGQAAEFSHQFRFLWQKVSP